MGIPRVAQRSARSYYFTKFRAKVDLDGDQAAAYNPGTAPRQGSSGEKGAPAW